jgi:hypothetical protein
MRGHQIKLAASMVRCGQYLNLYGTHAYHQWTSPQVTLLTFNREVALDCRPSQARYQSIEFIGYVYKACHKVGSVIQCYCTCGPYLIAVTGMQHVAPHNLVHAIIKYPDCH